MPGSADTFKWSFGDASGANTNDKVMDFKIAEGDVLDLKDLLVGETSAVAGNLSGFLTFAQVGANTVLTIDTNGTTALGDVQTVTFVGTNLFTQASATLNDSSDLITKMLALNALKTDV